MRFKTSEGEKSSENVGMHRVLVLQARKTLL